MAVGHKVLIETRRRGSTDSCRKMMISRNVRFVQRLRWRRHGLSRAGMFTITGPVTSARPGFVGQVLSQVAGLDAVVDAGVGGGHGEAVDPLHVLARVPGPGQSVSGHGACRHQVVGRVLRVVRVARYWKIFI